MTEIVFTRQDRWFPRVVRQDGGLRIELAGGADANHDPRTFSVPIEEAHRRAIESDLARHLLLWSALLPLCRDAGTRGDLDEAAAVALLDPVLLAAPDDLDATFRAVGWDRALLVAHGADVDLLEGEQVWAAMRAASETADWARAREHDADRRRAQAGVVLTPLDAAILRFTGQYVHGSTIPRRLPAEVDPALLPDVLQVVATAEAAAAPLRIGLDPRRGRRGTDKRAWEVMAAAVEGALRRAHPQLADPAVRTLSFLLCSEATDRARQTPADAEGDAGDEGTLSGPAASRRTTPLVFTDDTETELRWSPTGERTATAEFWEFVTERSSARNEVFTIEDEEAGEGIQLHFYADSVARITTPVPPRDGDDPVYHVEYALVDGIEGYRTVVRAFVDGGCAALDSAGPWMADIDDVERARRERDAGRSSGGPR